jgi:hypothetical protein
MKTASRFRGLTPASFVLLAPEAPASAEYSCVSHDESLHQLWLRRAQALRGRTYLADGAVDRQHLAEDGRLVLAQDRHSWHIIACEDEDACATMRFTFYRNEIPPDLLALAGSGLFESPAAVRSRRAIEAYQRECLAAGDVFGEVGGWAADASRRGSRKSAAVAISAWPICRSQGRVRAVSIVTERNQSLGILTRIAAAPLADEEGELPSWQDERYLCQMHLSAFTTWELHGEFENDALELAELLHAAPLFVGGTVSDAREETDFNEYGPRDRVCA